jgi:hypothetical protein
MTAVRHPGWSAPRPQRPAQLFGEVMSEWPQHGGSRGVQETVAREVACQRVELRQATCGPAVSASAIAQFIATTPVGMTSYSLS